MTDNPGAEYSTHINGLYIEINKDGGGTVGKDYTGTWSVTVKNGPVYIYDDDSLSTSTPRNHAWVADMAAAFASEEI